MNLSHSLTHRLSLLTILLLAITLAAWRFMPFVSSLFYGDDLFFYLSIIDGGYGAKVSDLIFSTYQERFRPIGFGYALLLFKLFGASSSPFIAVNLLFHGFSALLVFAIVRRISGENWILPLIMALTVATSRFSTVAITQAIAAEALSFSLFMGLVYSIARINEDSKISWRWGWLATFFGFLAMHAHERYIVVFVWLFVFFLLSPSIRQLSKDRRLALILTSLAIPLLNVAYKIFVLHSPFFVGTAGSHLDFIGYRILEHLTQAVLSIFGFNSGPEYLIGVKISSLPWFPIWLFAAALTISWLMLFLKFYRSIQGRDVCNKSEIFFPVMLLILGCLLLIPAISTIRVEQRWLMGSFVCVIILFPASVSGRIKEVARISPWLFALLISCSVVLHDNIFVKSFGNLYIAQSTNLVESIKRNIIGNNSRKSQEIVLVNTAPEHCSWTLAGGRFFQVYEGHSRLVKCPANIDESLKIEVAEDARILSLIRQPKEGLIDITNDWHIMRGSHSNNASFDFLANFSSGIINNNAKVDTPSGKGALRMSWRTPAGMFDTLTIVSGFTYRYDNLIIPTDAQFISGISMIYPSRSHARAVISVTAKDNSSTSAVYSFDLVPPDTSFRLQFYPISIPLPQFRGKRVSVTFGVETLGVNSDANWVGFAYPKIAVGG